ncbi:cation-translocating P-type ATPase [Hydrogenophilus thermoluteolus]|uniref:cation-translocating P-type ATPase n=1 Tax=Hydrogenophilus thermoluteolus TaxID=297 RepID=UPI00255210A2|nr:HAD-IC family P-type ATPase [Hydrogenophilus thermoluteolus]
MKKVTEGTKMPQWYMMTSKAVAEYLGSDPERGLPFERVAERLRQYGLNQLDPGKREGWWARLTRQLKNPLLFVLLVAAVVAFALGERVDAAVIVAVVLLSVAIGLYQEGKAQRALDAVAELLAPQAIVIRDGVRHEIPARDLVPGDLIWVEAGMRVPADARLVVANRLAVDESILTGESVPVEKRAEPLSIPDLPLADQDNCLWSGTLVVRGQATALVFATGKNSQLGRLGLMVGRAKRAETPLMERFSRFSWQVALAILSVSTLLFALAVWGPAQVRLEDAFMATVGIAVAAIPEGLPALVLVILAIGAERLAKVRALVRKLPAVETLGAVTVIGSDKTGTLTKNEMTITDVATPKGFFKSSGVGYAPEGRWQRSDDLQEGSLPIALFEAGVLCNDSALQVTPDGSFRPVGDPLEAAMITAAIKAGIVPESVQLEWRRVDSLPFDPEKRYMVTLHRHRNGDTLLLVKGAVEVIAPRCRGVCRASTLAEISRRADAQPFSDDHWLAVAESFASRGLRVIALACRQLPKPEGDEVLDERVLTDLLWLGLVGVQDPPRPEATLAVAECLRAGVRVVMITGDHPKTAQAVAQSLGLARAKGRPLMGSEIDQLDDAALAARLKETDVVSRATPEHKLRLVNLWVRTGEIVAMTGDGANDAPALAAAHVGIAMGQRGTDAARAAASVVLADDNFATIVRALRWGRIAYDNVKKTLLFILPTNFAQALVVGVALVLGETLPISATQILWVNLVTTVLLATPLAFEKGERRVMERPPRPPNEPLITRLIAWRVAVIGFLFAAVTHQAFFWALPLWGEEVARTFAVNTLVAMQVAYLFSCRTFVDNRWRTLLVEAHPIMYLAVTGIVLLQGVFTYAPPLQALFATNALPIPLLLLLMLITVVTFFVTESEKWVMRRIGVTVL